MTWEKIMIQMILEIAKVQEPSDCGRKDIRCNKRKIMFW
jgi:hypothetical protein